MGIAQLLIANFIFVLACVLGLWLVSLKLRDVTFMDPFWAIGMVLVAAVTMAGTHGASARQSALLIVAAAWGLRLGGFLFWRWRHDGPDPRYVRLIEKAQQKQGMGFARAALMKVFLTQAPMLWLVSLPVQLGQIDTAPEQLGGLAAVGILVAAVGIVFESVGDWQLSRFRADAANKGKIMDRGLWRYTRHPNYFGDACVWWGLYLIAAETTTGLYALPGPLLLTWTLIKWSGAATLERRMKRSRPAYEAYIARTSGFLPWPPKAAP